LSPLPEEELPEELPESELLESELLDSELLEPLDSLLEDAPDFSDEPLEEPSLPAATLLEPLRLSVL